MPRHADITAAAARSVQARRRIGDHVVETPLLTAAAIGETIGSQVLLKCENFQATGSFKARGALHAVRMLGDDERVRGVTTYSSGNHGQALAWAAAREGIRAVVYMPTTAPAPKVEAARTYGAEVRFAGTTSVPSPSTFACTVVRSESSMSVASSSNSPSLARIPIPPSTWTVPRADAARETS